MRLAKVVTATAVAGAALLSLSTPASATNPPYDGCPAPAICLYKNGGGTGSKVIIGGSFTPGTWGARVTLDDTNFLDGTSANNQVTSWLNNTNCRLNFYDAILPAQIDGWMDSTPEYHWGATGDWSFTGNNDRLSTVVIDCP
ncbi:peptidase inhibitor family I36 protein [Streptomyces flaveolus]|uniref:peptidase inhibitor family I36 protein n=1 Tax=Streptomyces flaveolus TaxID=67297 RepID=UPI0033DCEC2C